MQKVQTGSTAHPLSIWWVLYGWGGGVSPSAWGGPHTHTSSDKSKYSWSCTFTPTYAFTAWCFKHPLRNEVAPNFNRLTPNDPYMGHNAPLTSKRCILYVYSTNIGTEYFKHALYSPFLSSSKCSLFHNANLFGSCIIHILYTGSAKIKNKSGAKGLIPIKSTVSYIGDRLRWYYTVATVPGCW